MRLLIFALCFLCLTVNATLPFSPCSSYSRGDSVLVNNVTYYAKVDIKRACGTPPNSYWQTTRIITAPVVENVVNYKLKYDSVTNEYTLFKSTTFLQIAQLNKVIDSIISIVPTPKPPTNTDPTGKKLSFSFTLPKDATVSAGLYKGERLIRTIFNNKPYSLGKYSETFYPLTDDLDTIKSVDGMTVRVLSNNITDEWEGLVGNNSTYSTGPSTYSSYGHIQSMAIIGNKAYFGRSYNEAGESPGMFITTEPNTFVPILQDQGTNQNTVATAADGNTAYFGGRDEWAPKLGLPICDYVYGISSSNNTEALLPKGVAYKSAIGRTYKSIIDKVSNVNGFVTGMAFQKTGNYGFISHGLMNELHVWNRITGDITIVPFSNVTNLAVDNDNNLWVQTGVTLTKYHINLDGSL